MQYSNSVLKSFFTYNRSQRIGLVFFFIIILAAQCILFFCDFRRAPSLPEKERQEWLAFQKAVDSLKGAGSKWEMRPFNPNFITDFKGYKLGMSVEEIDRLQSYRKQGKFVNSAEEFRQVTLVSDSLLRAISPYFKFPSWVGRRSYAESDRKSVRTSEITKILDINKAGKDDLMKVYGIGDKLSDRILNEREKLGAFASMEQLYDIWGLSPEVLEKLDAAFDVRGTPQVKKINVNEASVKTLAEMPFFSYNLARQLVIFRTMNGNLKIEDLPKIKGFPVEKIKIIALYLEF